MLERTEYMYELPSLNESRYESLAACKEEFRCPSKVSSLWLSALFGDAHQGRFRDTSGINHYNYASCETENEILILLFVNVLQP